MIKIDSLCKTFHLYRKPVDRLKEIVFNKTFHREHHALKNVTFEVAKGETFGIIGENGSGKSTLLKIITGVLLPDGGHFHVDGKITGLLELGTGFNHEFSGIDNIYMNGTYIGMGRKEIDKKLDTIVAFTELGEFINEPIKTYSSGMLMRLAFSVAFHADPACFVVDEALSVGDAHFQQKCIQALKNFKKKGGSIVFVSHDMNAVKILCERALLLEKGEVLRIGTPEEVINTYNYLLSKKQGDSTLKVISRSEDALNYGNRKVVFEGIDMKNDQGRVTEIFISGKPCCIEIQLRAQASLNDITVGIMIRDRFGQDIFGVNSFHLKTPIQMNQGEVKTVQYAFDAFNIGPGKYTLTVAAHSQEIHVHDCYQWIDKVGEFEVVSGDDFIFEGVSRLTPAVVIH
jgi:lipopolysaccharide transport system ATP-binding protein